VINLSKSLFEAILAIGSLLVLGVSGAFAVATIRSQLTIVQIQLDLKESQIEFARKIQRNIDNNLIQIGILRREMNNVKNVLERHKTFKDSEEFFKENIPSDPDL
jgi:hypothetical protein